MVESKSILVWIPAPEMHTDKVSKNYTQVYTLHKMICYPNTESQNTGVPAVAH